MQVIIMESAEALAIQIERELIKHSCDAPVVDSILSCLHPIEVPNEVEKLVGKIRAGTPKMIAGDTRGASEYAVEMDLSETEAAALITAHSRTVPRAMLREVYNLSSIEWERSADAIAAKYGVKVEG